jgi:hypothetical protein
MNLCFVMSVKSVQSVGVFSVQPCAASELGRVDGADYYAQTEDFTDHVALLTFIEF